MRLVPIWIHNAVNKVKNARSQFICTTAEEARAVPINIGPNEINNVRGLIASHQERRDPFLGTFSADEKIVLGIAFLWLW